MPLVYREAGANAKLIYLPKYCLFIANKKDTACVLTVPAKHCPTTFLQLNSIKSIGKEIKLLDRTFNISDRRCRLITV